ncbi:hypothetical protein [Lacipirellula parvula]|uniref:Uncharacterized protein n=1 Tax=Lacipirellula parvula TaxID=2650471 RepID=A0A5K7X3W3_9BACT|nr:hypothetical protein [Lacipirellula parvula]BBO30512.1 hypothetical protein PLANPX_0124 [Lacipirellula parvula]
MKRLPLLTAAALCVLPALLGCWEEIKYEPGPAAVRHETADNSTAEPPASAVSPAPEPVLPTEPAEIATAAPADTAPVEHSPAEAPLVETPPLDLATETPVAEPPAAASPEAVATPADAATQPSLEADGAQPPAGEGASFDELFPSETPAPDSPAVAPAERLAVWQAAQKWSFAAAMYAKQLPAERYEATLAEAAAAAVSVGVELPPLPKAGDGASPEQAVVAALQGEPAAAVIASATERFGPAAGGLANVAIRSNLLLLSYSPRRGDAAIQAGDFTAAAEASALPAEAWQPLATLLDGGGEYVAVRSAIFAFHRQVDELLAH